MFPKSSEYFLNRHYFESFGDSLSYIVIAYLLPIILLIVDAVCLADKPTVFISSTLILTFSLSRDYFYEVYKRTHIRYVLFGMGLAVQFIISVAYYVYLSSGDVFYFPVYVVFCVISGLVYFYPFWYFVKDCVSLADEYFDSKNNKDGFLSNNGMSHGDN